MPRGQKRSKIDILNEQLEKKNAEISKMEEALKEAKDTRKKILEEIKIEKVSTMQDIIDKRGLNVDQVLDMLNNMQKDQ